MKRVIVSSLVLFIAAILLQGFQCASQEMTTAKLDFQKQKFDSAIENVKKELKKNPKNEDAHILYAQILMKKGDLVTAATVLAESREFIKSKKNKDMARFLESQLLAGAYGEAYQNYQKYFSKKEDKYLDASLEASDLSLTLRPQLSDLYNLRGRIYEIKNDDKNAIIEYEKFASAHKKEYELAKDTGINLDMFREEALTILGKPVESSTFVIDSVKGKTSIVDKLDYKSNTVYLHSVKETSGASYKVTGWRLNLPESWSEKEKMQYNPINIDPFAALAQKYYDNKNYDKALNHLDYLTTLQPTNKEAGSLKIQLLRETGNTDRAISELEEATKKSPDNKRYWLQFGDLLSNLGRYEEAIDKYEKALAIDSKYDYALYNVASAYKNLAGTKQKKEQEKLDSDPDYIINTELYFPELEKSAEYYTRTSETDKFKDNHNVLLQLANIYQVLDNTDKLNSTLSKLDKIQYNVPQNQKRAFYLDLLKIYSTMKNQDKTSEIESKLKNLK
ncbi:MAG: tetratricopeptide repeat protein [Chlorobiota bacterium]